MSNDNADSNEAPVPDQSKSSRTCQKCGTTMESSHLGQVCSACLLQIGFESDANEKHLDPTINPTASDAASLNVEDSLEAVQKLFPGLEIIEGIGQGGMGIVYKARQTHLGRLVALKLLRAKFSGDPSLAERFTREARALAKLSHPNIVGVHDFGQAGDRPFLIMEYVEGVNLRSMLESKSLNPVEAMAMVPAICEALQFAHDEGVVHRDIKPENILVDRRGRVRIADFGLARLMSRSKDEWTLTGTRQVMGTPHYMAPEQIEHPQQVDHRADIYSLGVVIYEMLTGELPIGRFELPSNKINVDVRFDDIVLRTLEKEPMRRYQHVTEVQTAVEKIATDSSLSEGAASGANSNISAWGTLPSDEPMDVFLRIAVFGVLAAAVVDMGIAIAMFADMMPSHFTLDLMIGSTYHATLALLLGVGGWQLLNHGSKHWLLTVWIAIAPIHIGVLGAWPFAILYLVLFLIGFRYKSTEQLNAKLASEFPSKSQSLNDGLAIALSALHQYWKRLASWLVANWPVLWRKAVRGFLLTGLWFGGCGITSLSLYWFYGRSHFPTILSIYDHSARSVTLSTSEDIRLRIDSNSAHIHSGFTIQPEDLKRTEVQFSLYRVSDPHFVPNRTDLQAKNLRAVYLSEAFHAHFNSTNAVEYEIQYPSYVNGFVVDPLVFKSKSDVGWKINNSATNLQYPSLPDRSNPYVNTPLNGQPVYDEIGSFSQNNIRSLQYLPTLTSAKPIESWLSSSGMSDEQATRTAAGLYRLLVDIAENGGVVPNATGDNRLRPIADMLDKEIFTPKSGSKISIGLSTQFWAIEAWIGTTVAVGVLGFLSFIGIHFFRTSRIRSGNNTSELQ